MTTDDRLAALLHEKWTCRRGHDRVPYPCQTLAGILAAAGVRVPAPDGLDVRDLAATLSSNPKVRHHDEETDAGWSAWDCVPVVDALQAALVIAPPPVRAEPRR